MKILKSYNVQVWCGLKERDTEYLHTIDEVKIISQKFVDEVGECVSVTPTEFIYTKGNENGVVVGFIQYPRFPRKKKEIKSRAIQLATILMFELNQYKVTVTTPKKSLMLENKILKMISKK